MGNGWLEVLREGSCHRNSGMKGAFSIESVASMGMGANDVH